MAGNGGAGMETREPCRKETPESCIWFHLVFGPVPNCVHMQQESRRRGKSQGLKKEKLLRKSELSNY